MPGGIVPLRGSGAAGLFCVFWKGRRLVTEPSGILPR